MRKYPMVYDSPTTAADEPVDVPKQNMLFSLSIYLHARNPRVVCLRLRTPPLILGLSEETDSQLQSTSF